MVKSYGKKTTLKIRKEIKQRKLFFQEVKTKRDLRIPATFKIIIVAVYIFVWKNKNKAVKYADKGFWKLRSLTPWIMSVFKENFTYTGFKNFFFFFMAETSFFPPYKLNVEPNGEILTYSHLPSPISPNTMIQSQVSTGGTPWTQCDPVSTIWKSLISHSRFNTFPIVSLIPKSNDIDDIV